MQSLFVKVVDNKFVQLSVLKKMFAQESTGDLDLYRSETFPSLRLGSFHP